MCRSVYGDVVEGGLCLLEFPEAMHRVLLLLCTLKARCRCGDVGNLCLLEVLEEMRRVLLDMLEAVEAWRYEALGLCCRGGVMNEKRYGVRG